MSGEPVYLRGGADGDVEALVRAAGLVVEHSGVPTAVIGGLAVTCRLATAHRATADVDFVVGEPEVLADQAGAIDNLVGSGVASRKPGSPANRIYVAGTKVEIIETSYIDPADAQDIEPERARLFVLAHRWALETATPCVIAVVGTEATAEVPVATAAALVSMKLHSIQDRNDDRKRASDAWDLYRLLDAYLSDSEFRAAFASAPAGLLSLIEMSIDRVFHAEVTKTRRWLATYGDPAWATEATEESLRQFATDLLEIPGFT